MDASKEVGSRKQAKRNKPTFLRLVTRFRAKIIKQKYIENVAKLNVLKIQKQIKVRIYIHKQIKSVWNLMNAS